MDNFHIDVISEGDGSLGTALSLAFSRHSGHAVGYLFEPTKNPPQSRLVFLWSMTGEATAIPFPFKMDTPGAADFARRWLKEADYGRQPDHDGDNGRGWRVYTTSWGHVDGHRYAICAVEPAWAMYGK